MKRRPERTGHAHRRAGECISRRQPAAQTWMHRICEDRDVSKSARVPQGTCAGHATQSNRRHIVCMGTKGANNGIPGAGPHRCPSARRQCSRRASWAWTARPWWRHHPRPACGRAWEPACRRACIRYSKFPVLRSTSKKQGSSRPAKLPRNKGLGCEPRVSEVLHRPRPLLRQSPLGTRQPPNR